MYNKIAYSDDLFNSFPVAFLVTNRSNEIIFANEKIIKVLGKPLEEIMGQTFSSAFPDINSVLSRNGETGGFINLQFNQKDYLLHITGDNNCKYYLFYSESEINELLKTTDLYQDLHQDLKAIFENTYDVIYVSDGSGNTLRVSSASERLWGRKKERLIGKNAYELEEMGVYKPSITRLVIEQEKQIQTIQTTGTGRRLLVLGTPIKNDEGEIIRVINTSKDITDVDKLESELHATKGMLAGYISELKSLRLQQQGSHSKVISRSTNMKNVISLAKKVSDVYSTILIYGESGVGKEMIARYIHDQGDDASDPFVTIKCGALPPKLLEEELFGKEGALNGSLLNKTYKGTLLIDEVDEIPLDLQSKLIQYLTKMEAEKDSNPNFSLRIIAITNQSLTEKVQNGLFRKDLFYLLNVIPIRIPPLRERNDDILPLTMLFFQHFNQLYSMNKQLGKDIIDSLLNYPWPGNVRELRNLVERLFVISLSDIISKAELPQHILATNDDDDIVHLSQIAPMKEVLNQTEKKLIKMAMTEYETTTQIADALDVNQSTVSRKINKYFSTSE